MSKPGTNGLSAGARRRWSEQVAALDAAGDGRRARRLELVSSWARPIQAAGHDRRWWYDRLRVKQLAWFRRRVAGGGLCGTGKLGIGGGSECGRGGDHRAAG